MPNSRIKVENRGKTAANDCKASLILTAHREYRIAWMIPKEDCTVIINAHDVEFLQLNVVMESMWKMQDTFMIL